MRNYLTEKGMRVVRNGLEICALLGIVGIIFTIGVFAGKWIF